MKLTKASNIARFELPAVEDLELSIVMPCLNEAETLAVCVDKAIAALRENNIAGEVVVADNGSTDGSQKIATDHGARIVNFQDLADRLLYSLLLVESSHDDR